MPIRMSGMVSGLDTESLVSALTMTTQTKINTYKKAQTKVEWKQDAWKSINSKVYSIYNKAGNLRLSTSYNLRKSSVSDPTKATVTASSDAVNGTQSLKIKQLAKSGYLTGAKLANGTTESTTLSSLGYSGGSSTISVQTSKGTKEVAVDGNTKISDFVSALKDSGVNANFDAANGRIFVSSKDAGAAGDFSLTSSSGNGLQALNALGLSVESSSTTKAYQSSAAHAYGIGASGTPESIYQLDADGNIKYDDNGQPLTTGVTFDKNATKSVIADAIKALAQANESNKSLEASKAELNDKIEYTKAKNAITDIKTKNGGTELVDLLSKADPDKTYVGSDGKTYTHREEIKDTDGTVTGYKYYNMKKDDGGNDVIDEDNAKTENVADAYKTVSERITELAKTTDLGLITSSTDSEGNEVTDETALNELKAQIKTALAIDDNETMSATAKADYFLSDLTAAENQITTWNQDIANNNATIEANKAWAQSDYSSLYESGALSDSKIDALADTLATKVESAVNVVNDPSSVPISAGATRVNGQDAIIELNGAEFTSTSNSFSINGLTINALAVTGPDEEISVTTATDTQGMYDKIKDFLSEYNAVINEISKIYNADSASGYEPLTDDEKAEMTDSEIEKWETKVKDALLRKDSTLGTVMRTMTNAMSQMYEVDGESYSLSSFGIQTLGYLNASKNENYAYHIDGDPDDESSSGKTDKLMAALSSDPDKVVGFMQKLMAGLYSELDIKMKSTDFSSAYTIYNDKQMTKDYNNYKTLISNWEDKLETQETKYYKQFSSMESSLAQLQSNTSSLSSMLG